MVNTIFSILIFPGFLFLFIFSLAGEFIDRKIYARLQNRVGPPWYQPLADFIKLVAKAELIPREANPKIFGVAPLFALASVITAFLYIPVWKRDSLFPFNGDIIVVLYFMLIPTLAIFIGGWYSTSLFARIGSVRLVLQLFAYEVPLFMGILSSALLANTWSLSGLVIFYQQHPSYCVFNLPGFVISIIALLGKLEKVPFDIPEAETEIVAGSFTEYSGKLLALLRLTLDMEMIVASTLLAAVFLPFGLGSGSALGFMLYIIKVLVIIALISLLRSVFARLRIDQMINFCWKYITPIAIFQLLLNLTAKGIIMR